MDIPLGPVPTRKQSFRHGSKYSPGTSTDREANCTYPVPDCSQQQVVDQYPPSLTNPRRLDGLPKFLAWRNSNRYFISHLKVGTCYIVKRFAVILTLYRHFMLTYYYIKIYIIFYISFYNLWYSYSRHFVWGVSIVLKTFVTWSLQFIDIIYM